MKDDTKLKLITEEHKIMFMKSMQIKDKKESQKKADEVIKQICKDIDWTENNYIVVATMSIHMLKGVTEVLKELKI